LELVPCVASELLRIDSTETAELASEARVVCSEVGLVVLR
jgi:hypothetical protein